MDGWVRRRTPEEMGGSLAVAAPSTHQRHPRANSAASLGANWGSSHDSRGDRRGAAAGARIHLVVGRWNRSLAELLPGIDTLETLDAPWLVRRGADASMEQLIYRAWAWRAQKFDLALNLEPDIRSNLLLSLSGAVRRVGFSSGGGGAFLTHALGYLPSIHTAANALRVVDASLPVTDGARELKPPYERLQVPGSARREASRLLGRLDPSRLLVGLHASRGREIKQWHLGRLAEVATRLGRDFGATIVLIGTPEDRPLVDRVAAALPPDVTNLIVADQMDLTAFAGLLERLSLFVVGDTGPMHLAAAVGTPVVALFGPSDPRRYGPLTDRARVVTADLWCRSCNRVRKPPSRCMGRVPDCLSGIEAEAVYTAAGDLLRGDVALGH